jgi:hypothetical protein
MLVTYKPKGSAEPRTWNFQPDDLFEIRCEFIERRYAKAIGEKQAAFEEWRMAVLREQASARRVLLWHLLDLDHPGKLRIEDVNPRRGELKVEATKSELVELRATLENVGGMDDMQRELMLAQVDAQIASAPEDDGGKAPSNDSVSAIG